jgi:hypothetical protein
VFNVKYGSPPIKTLTSPASGHARRHQVQTQFPGDGEYRITMNDLGWACTSVR